MLPSAFSAAVRGALLPLACAMLVFIGVGLVVDNLSEAQDETQAAFSLLGVSLDSVQNYRAVEPLTRATSVITCLLACGTVLTGSFRALRLYRTDGVLQNQQPWLVLTTLLLVLTLVAAALLVVNLLAAAFYAAALVLADRISLGVLGSEVDTKWSQLHKLHSSAGALVNAFNPLASNTAMSKLKPSVDALRANLSLAGSACKQDCLDLMSFPGVVITNLEQRCVCDVSHVAAAQPHFRAAWRDNQVKVVVGLCLAWAGMSLLLMVVTWYLSRTRTEAGAQQSGGSICDSSAMNDNASTILDVDAEQGCCGKIVIKRNKKLAPSPHVEIKHVCDPHTKDITLFASPVSYGKSLDSKSSCTSSQSVEPKLPRPYVDDYDAADALQLAAASPPQYAYQYNNYPNRLSAALGHMRGPAATPTRAAVQTSEAYGAPHVSPGSGSAAANTPSPASRPASC